jgi:hypothetical protein
MFLLVLEIHSIALFRLTHRIAHVGSIVLELVKEVQIIHAAFPSIKRRTISHSSFVRTTKTPLSRSECPPKYFVAITDVSLVILKSRSRELPECRILSSRVRVSPIYRKMHTSQPHV